MTAGAVDGPDMHDRDVPRGGMSPVEWSRTVVEGGCRRVFAPVGSDRSGHGEGTPRERSQGDARHRRLVRRVTQRADLALGGLDPRNIRLQQTFIPPPDHRYGVADKVRQS
jgi:hypothetical protein